VGQSIGSLQVIYTGVSLGFFLSGGHFPNPILSHLDQGLFRIRRRKTENLAGCQWLTPVILATWEADIRRTVVLGQPGQIILKTPPPK
jgi:hypothetical protein